ncbi:MAG: hypothetical protein ACK5MD_03455 [Flavobacteriales bacterium]
MKKYHFYIIFPLFISLVIYTFFRSENIIINQIIHDFYPKSHQFSFNFSDFLIYNLPQGLWVFSTTLISKNLYVKKFNLAFSPLIFSFYIEIIQYFHFTNGTFDYWDLITALFGFLIAYSVDCPYKKEQLLNNFNFRTILFSFSYFIVILSVYNANHHFLNI